MRILMVASEMAPFARTGGLGDVLGALPRALAALGQDVRVVMPRYGFIDENSFPLRPLDLSIEIPVNTGTRPLTVELYRDHRSRLETYFIDNEDYFDRRELYHDPRTGQDYTDNDERFLFLSRGALEIARHLDWKPDVVHVHDWQAGLAPVYLKTVYSEDSFFQGSVSVLTIHNLAYQGTFDPSRFRKLNLPEHLMHPTAPFEFYGKVNFLKAAIMFADRITTVSPRYATEIQSSEELGCGLQDVLKQRRQVLSGILNGVDYTVWSPSRDKLIPYRYHINNLSGKRMNKVELLNTAKLPVRANAPLIGIIGRLVDQKGFDLIAAAADRIFAMDVQVIILGTGDERHHQALRELEVEYPDKLKVYLKFDDALAHRIEAGADIYLMPSRFEPCGLNQMYSLKYGTMPVVREVGGLADTVVDYNPETGEGTGFVFREYTPEALLDALQRAIALFSKRRKWTKLMKAGMKQDFSWQCSARKYVELFESLRAA
ncbi:MAG: glycogen synthase GlgA [Candidatus Zixiibacteriota bacterium]